MRELSDEKQSLIREKLIKIYYENPFNSHLGYEYLELNENYSKSRMKVKDQIQNNYGSVHGGALLAFVDACAGTTASMCGYYVTTVSSHLNFLLPAAKTEYIYCECLKLKTGRHISVFDIRVTDDEGNLLDSGEFSFFISKEEVLSENILSFKEK